MRRAELDVDDLPQHLRGLAEVIYEDDHAPHTFLYVPDLAERTGWNTHRVPERQPERREREVGFRR